MKYDFLQKALGASPMTSTDLLYGVMRDALYINNKEEAEDFILADLASDFRDAILDSMHELNKNQKGRLDGLIYPLLGGIAAQFEERYLGRKNPDPEPPERLLPELRLALCEAATWIAEGVEAVKDKPINRMDCKLKL